MSLEYEWNKEDLKKELQKKRAKTNFIFILIAIFLYLFLMYNGLISKIFDNKIILLYGLVYISIVGIILFISTKLYVYTSLRKNDKKTNKAYGLYKLVLDEKHLNININDTNITYKYEDITKYKKHKNYFFICTNNDKLGLIFKKNVLGNDKYNELIKYLDNKIK